MIIWILLLLTVMIHSGRSDYITEVNIPATTRRLEIERRIIESGDGIDTRIKGGDRAYHEMFPWLAGILTNRGNRRQLCSGSLISSDRVLTAAHCMRYKNGTLFSKNTAVVLGADYLYSGGIRMDNCPFKFHPDQNIDIAMINLPKHVDFGPTVKPVALPTNWTKELFLGYTAHAAGFGYLRNNPDVDAKYNQYIDLEVIDSSTCNEQTLLKLCTSTMDALGSSVGPNQGDSGGPLTVRICGQSILIGVVKSQRGKGTTYIRVTEILDFIEANM